MLTVQVHGPSRAGETTVGLIAGVSAGLSLRFCPLLPLPRALRGLEPLSGLRGGSGTMLFSQSLCFLLRKAWKVPLNKQAQTVYAFWPNSPGP